MLNFCRKRPLFGGLLVALLFFLLTYFAYGHNIGKMTKEIVVSAFESYTALENNPYADIISDENYNHIVQRKYNDFVRPDAHDSYRLSSPFVLHWFTGAKVWIKYDYAYYQGDDMKSASSGCDIYFYLELQNGKWKIIDIYEAP